MRKLICVLSILTMLGLSVPNVRAEDIYANCPLLRYEILATEYVDDITFWAWQKIFKDKDYG